VIRPCLSSDAARICEIYNHYVRETVVTFEEVPIAEPEMAGRIADVTGRLPWLVCEDAGAVAGYAYATMWKTRSAYRYSVESTVYLAADSVGRGIGSALYRALLADLRARDLHCALGCIALPNAASVALHERLGFRKIGEFKEVGRKLSRWVDVGYWQLLF
jgi:L-amino acid N-acyltransferase YncA